MVDDELKYQLYNWTFLEFSIMYLDCKFYEDVRFTQNFVLVAFRNTIHRESYLYLLMRTRHRAPPDLHHPLGLVAIYPSKTDIQFHW